MILGIDPGPKESAFVVWDGRTILDHQTIPNEDVLTAVLYSYSQVDRVAIEWIVGYGLTVGSETFDTCRWVGKFEQAAGGAALLTRKEIKLHLCSNTQAKDVHIRQAVIDRIGPPGSRKSPGPTFGLKGHEWSALSVAVVWWDLHGSGAQR